MPRFKSETTHLGVDILLYDDAKLNPEVGCKNENTFRLFLELKEDLSELLLQIS
ncbi:MAG: hypothetical protein Q8862_13105 [Bacteroidota bacterium]|nr:hypothetical protein [Bacteroidota bacterium]MDP4206176.1 hypothetical protein [Bacteroidota bacterium]